MPSLRISATKHPKPSVWRPAKIFPPGSLPFRRAFLLPFPMCCPASPPWICCWVLLVWSLATSPSAASLPSSPRTTISADNLIPIFHYKVSPGSAFRTGCFLPKMAAGILTGGHSVQTSLKSHHKTVENIFVKNIHIEDSPDIEELLLRKVVQ